MTAPSRRAVRAFHKYRDRNTDHAEGTTYFCGACDLDIGGIYGHNYCGWPTTLADFIAETEAKQFSWPSFDEPRGPWRHYRFCPWCGNPFPEDWHEGGNTPVENDRVIDHFRNPGWHRGERHEFVGAELADAVGDHWLGVSGGDKLCWCEPTVTASITGCTIRHAAIDYATYLAMQPTHEPTLYDDDGS